jgi:hypothetical protein
MPLPPRPNFNPYTGKKSSSTSKDGLPLLCITYPITGKSVLTWLIKGDAVEGGRNLNVDLYLNGEGSALGVPEGCKLYNGGSGKRADGTYKNYPSIKRSVRCKDYSPPNPKGVWKTEFCEKDQYVPGRVWTWASKMPIGGSIDATTGKPWELEVREATADERKITLAAEGVAEGLK